MKKDKQYGEGSAAFAPITMIRKAGHKKEARRWHWAGALLFLLIFASFPIMVTNAAAGVTILLLSLFGMIAVGIATWVRGRQAVQEWNEQFKAQEFERQVQIAEEAARRINQ